MKKTYLNRSTHKRCAAPVEAEVRAKTLTMEHKIIMETHATGTRPILNGVMTTPALSKVLSKQAQCAVRAVAVSEIVISLSEREGTRTTGHGPEQPPREPERCN